LVLDADGLNLLAEQPFDRVNWLLTPHPGEASRLLERDTAALQADRLSAAGDLAVRFGAAVILKGPCTLIAVPDGAGTAHPGARQREDRVALAVCDYGN